MAMIGIYKITSPSGKVYIGQSRNIDQRFTHYGRLHCKGQFALYNSFLKHGVENHLKEIIYELPDDIEQDVLDRYEQLYITAFKECGITLLNLREGGRGGKHGQSTKDKIRQSLKGNIINENQLNGLRKGWSAAKNKKLSDVTKKKLSEINKGKVHSKDTKDKMSVSHKLRKRNFETGAKISATRLIKYGRQIEQFNKNGQFIKGFDSIKDAVKATGINRSSIAENLSGRNLTAGNYIFKYKN
jgi:group I intron endonuclease